MNHVLYPWDILMQSNKRLAPEACATKWLRATERQRRAEVRSVSDAGRTWAAYLKEVRGRPHMTLSIPPAALGAERVQDPMPELVRRLDGKLKKCRAMEVMPGVFEDLGGQIFFHVVKETQEAKVLVQTRHKLTNRMSMSANFFPDKQAP